MTYRFILVLALSTLGLGGCMQQSEVTTLQSRVTQQDQTIRQLNSQIAGVQPAQADTWAQVQTLRQEMATLKGQMDNLAHATAGVGGVAGMGERLTRHDAALRLLETQMALNLNLGAPMGAGSAAGGMPGYAPNPNQMGQPAGQNMGQQVPQTAASPEYSQPQSEPETVAPAATDVAKALYDSGYAAFTGGKYQEALNSFTDFTKNYAKHSLIGNAWFWRGESSFQLKNYANAALDYEQVISKYPKNAKVPSAYLKQAICFMNVNKKDVAKYRLDELIKKYPNAPEAGRAKKLLAEIK